jgi:hypothetical protein
MQPAIDSILSILRPTAGPAAKAASPAPGTGALEEQLEQLYRKGRYARAFPICAAQRQCSKRE